MNKTFLTLLLLLSCACCFGQDNPYAIFGYKAKVQYKTDLVDIYRVKNHDPKSRVQFLVFDRDNKQVRLLDKKDSVIETISLTDDQILRWVSIDPAAEKYPQMSPYGYAANNPIKFIDPTGKVIDLPGDKKAQDAYIQMLHNSTGNNYQIKDNVLSMTGVDKDFKGTKSAELTDIISKGIGAKDTYTLNLVGANGDDKGVFVDSYVQGKIDVSDLQKVGQTSTALQGAMIGHFLNEVQQVPGYDNMDATTRAADFTSAHNPSLNVEGQIYGQLVGDPTITTRQQIINSAPVDGYQTVTFKYNNANQFNLVQGATGVTVPTTIMIGGKPFQASTTTVNSTGELKSVTKVQ